MNKFEILKRRELAPAIVLMDVSCPRLAAAAMPGQFLIVVPDEHGERIPLTICDIDRKNGTVTIVIQAIGHSTKKICSFKEGEHFRDVVGPLGNASELTKKTDEELAAINIVFIAGGLGAAPVYPQVKFLAEHGVKPHVIIGAKTKELVIMEDDFRKLTPNVHIATDDGSYGFHGLVTDLLKSLVEGGEKFGLCVAIGPMIMMKFAVLTAKSLGIPSIVSLNSMMVDGTGMCGACRVSVGGKTRFACVEGPEFDGELVDFDLAMRRGSMYRTVEQRENEKDNKKDHSCKIGGTGNGK